MTNHPEFPKNFRTVHPLLTVQTQFFVEFLMLPNVTPIQMSNWQLLSLSIPIDDPDDYQAQKLFEGKRKPTNCLTMLLRIQAVAPTTRKEFRKGNHDLSKKQKVNIKVSTVLLSFQLKWKSRRRHEPKVQKERIR